MADPQKQRVNLNAVMKFIYENGAGNYGFAMEGDEITAATGLSKPDFREVIMMMINLGYMGKSTMTSVGLTDAGQREAARLSALPPLKSYDTGNVVNVHSTYSIVQVAGSGSQQTATMSIDQQALAEVLGKAEAELATLKMSEPEKAEAKGLIASLRSGIAAQLAAAGMRAMGGALAAILTAAGSVLGQRIAELLGIAVG